MRKYAAWRLGRSEKDASFQQLFAAILQKAESRFVYVAFLVGRLLQGSLPIESIDALAVGDDLYRSFLDRLDSEFHPKLAEEVRDVLVVLAAEERAHDWMFGAGAQLDRAIKGAILVPEARHWPGLPLGRLAELTDLDIIGPQGQRTYDGRFLEILLAIESVLAVSRAEATGPNYRIGLKGLTEQMLAHPMLQARFQRVRSRIAKLGLDALDGYQEIMTKSSAGIAEAKWARDAFEQACDHLLAHIRLSQLAFWLGDGIPCGQCARTTLRWNALVTPPSMATPSARRTSCCSG